ncbi:MAG: hypothetical protein AABZ08_04140 [Planctomycetota bacterium]
MQHDRQTHDSTTLGTADGDGTPIAIAEIHGSFPAHESPWIIREQALRLAIRTGWTPNVDLVWKWQTHEGNRPCFGQFKDACNPECRWRPDCQRLRAEPVHERSCENPFSHTSNGVPTELRL